MSMYFLLAFASYVSNIKSLLHYPISLKPVKIALNVTIQNKRSVL